MISLDRIIMKKFAEVCSEKNWIGKGQHTIYEAYVKNDIITGVNNSFQRVKIPKPSGKVFAKSFL